MHYTPKILFIGTFLSKLKGTKGVAETLSELLKKDGINIKLVSNHENKLLRIVDIIMAILLHDGKKVHIDVFSGHAFLIARVASLIAAYRNKKIILTLHGGKLIEFAMRNSKQIDFVFNKAFYIQTPSLFLKEYFESLGYTIHYLPNPLQIEKFPYKRDKIKKHSLLWVRAFTSIYNPDIAIRVLSELKKVYPDATLTMVGPDKGILNYCKELIEELKIQDSLDITGKVDNRELYKFYQSHEIFLNTTSYESFGVAVVEAAACGIPIVSNNIGEIPFIWEDQKNILLVNDNNINDYVKHITTILENKGIADGLSLNARKKAEEFRWENLKLKWINLLNN